MNSEMNVKNYLNYKVCWKKEEQRLFFSSFLDLESSGVWAGYWHYLKKLLANSIYSSYVPLRVQDNGVYLDVAERFSFNRLFVWSYSEFFRFTICRKMELE